MYTNKTLGASSNHSNSQAQSIVYLYLLTGITLLVAVFLFVPRVVTGG